MRNLHEYSLPDWRRLRPLSHAYKTALYRASTAWHVRRRSTYLAAAINCVRAEDQPALAITIAFEAPWAVRHQIVAGRRSLEDATLVICDNSRDSIAASQIEAICRDAGVTYLRLPVDPTKKGSRSHAMAINWAYRNLVCAVAPACFAFLDHDLFPTKPVRFTTLIEHQPIYGRLRHAAHRWFLWAGFCVFDGRYATSPVLDFSQDWFNGLDTGGANYRLLYKSLDPAGMSFASLRREERLDPLTGTHVPVEFVDDWLHFTNVSGWDASRRLEPALLERMLMATLPE